MTPQQLRAFDYVRDRITRTGYAPTIREIGEHLDLGSTSSVARLVDGLVDSGHLRRSAEKARGLMLADEPDLRAASLDAIRAELARRGETIGAFDRPVQRAYGRRPSCAADTCGYAVEKGHLMCRTHWLGLPRDLRDQLLAAHSGVLRSKAPSDLGRFQALLNRAIDLADGLGGRA